MNKINLTVINNSSNDLMPMISSYNYAGFRLACDPGYIGVLELLISAVLKHKPDVLTPMINSYDNDDNDD